jgi:hypothetical protein
VRAPAAGSCCSCAQSPPQAPCPPLAPCSSSLADQPCAEEKYHVVIVQNSSLACVFFVEKFRLSVFKRLLITECALLTLHPCSSSLAGSPCIGDTFRKFFFDQQVRVHIISDMIPWTNIHNFVMKQSLRIHLKSLRPRREIVN